MTIEPDTKDWTWVLERPCPECGFAAGGVAVEEVGALVRANAARWPAVLARPGAAVRADPATWSDLEYACHVRDVFRKFDERLTLMLEQDDPLFENWDQDATAVQDGYAAQDPAVVAVELIEAADAVATSFDAVPKSAHARPGRRSDGSVFTVATLARYFAHDPVHHLADVNG